MPSDPVDALRSLRDQIEFVRARLDEDWRAARVTESDDYWRAWHESTLSAWQFKDEVATYLAGLVPTRVLAENMFKHDLLRWCERSLFWDDDELKEPDWGNTVFDARWMLRSMAAVYSSHPDYKPHWTAEES